jgi:hypothetical protein
MVVPAFDLADAANMRANADYVENLAISNCNIVLNHAERRMAQLALLKLLTLRQTNTAILLRYFSRLQSLRAAQLEYQNFHGTNL